MRFAEVSGGVGAVTEDMTGVPVMVRGVEELADWLTTGADVVPAAVRGGKGAEINLKKATFYTNSGKTSQRRPVTRCPKVRPGLLCLLFVITEVHEVKQLQAQCVAPSYLAGDYLHFAQEGKQDVIRFIKEGGRREFGSAVHFLFFVLF